MVNKELYFKALEVRALYNRGQITRKEAKELIKDYEDYFNQRAVELAKKYSQKPVKFSFNSFMR